MRSRWFGLFLAAFAVAASVWAYPRLPETVTVHWNFRGVPDGYAPRFWAALLGPVLVLVLTGAFAVLPRLDPRRENYAKFLPSYWMLANAVIAFGAFAHLLIIAHALGYAVQIDRLVPAGIGVLFVFLGNYLTRVQPNWLMGIRTPWTLSSDAVWRKTHRTGGWLFVAGGVVIALAGAVAPKVAFLPLVVTALLVMAGIPIVQSYVLWKREQGKAAVLPDRPH